MSKYERAYYKGYTDGSSAAGSKYTRRNGIERAAWIFFSVSVCICTAFAIAASAATLLGLA